MEILDLMTAAHRAMIFTPATLARLEACGRVRTAPTATEHQRPEVRELIAAAEVVLTGTGTAKLALDMLRSAPRLRAIIHAAGTVRPIVDVEAYDLGLQISSQAPTNALPVAEYSLAMILLELKGVRAIEQTYRARRGEVDVDGILASQGNFHRRVGIIAASSIGRRVIDLLRPFDLEVVVADPFLTTADAAALGAQLVDLPTLLATSDLVSLHAPLLPDTINMIGASELALLRDGSVFLNTARGALVEQQALIAELSTGRFRAVMDVTYPEIPDEDSLLWDLENVVLTPHVAGSRGLELRRIGEGVVEEVTRLSRGQPLRYEVTRQSYLTNA